MLTCQEVTEYLLDYELGDLPEDLTRLVEGHHALCPPCASFARTYKAVPDMVRAALETRISDELQAELDASVLAAIRKSA